MQPLSIIGKPLSQVDTPALLLNLDLLKTNINRMASFFSDKTSRLRPHFKSHKCTRITKLQLEAGAVGITCAKLGEAEVLADAGVSDILIANQIVGELKTARLVELAKKARPMVAVDSADNIRDLSAAASRAGVTIRVLVEVDIGMNRCGVAPGEPALELARLTAASPGLDFEGLQGYEGHLVLLRDEAERTQKTRDALKVLVDTRRLLEQSGIAVKIVSSGGTGTYQVTGSFPGIDEVQAGSYAAMDWYYSEIRPEFEQALSVLTTIISRSKPGRAIVDVGTKGIGAEFGPPRLKNLPDGSVVKFSSEEHGTLQLPDSFVIGDKVEIIPSHGCTTSNLYREFIVHKDGRIVDVWPIEGSGKMT